MNQQIEQLALQAGFNLHNDVIDGHDFKHEIEKFAELIVAECIDTVSDSSVEYCTRPQIASEIKQHFGVK